MINLCLVVIATQFSETKQREHALMKSEQRARQLHQSASTLASDSQPGSCYEEIIRYLAHLGRKAWRRLCRCYAQTRTRFHCVCACHEGSGSGDSRPGGEMNGLAHRHSGHAPSDLSHLHQLYHHHHQRHHLQRQSQAVPAVSNGGNGLNYPFISPLFSHWDSKGWEQKRPAVNRLPHQVVEHGKNEGACVSASQGYYLSSQTLFSVCVSHESFCLISIKIQSLTISFTHISRELEPTRTLSGI